MLANHCMVDGKRNPAGFFILEYRDLCFTKWTNFQLLCINNPRFHLLSSNLLFTFTVVFSKICYLLLLSYFQNWLFTFTVVFSKKKKKKKLIIIKNFKNVAGISSHIPNTQTKVVLVGTTTTDCNS